MMIESTSINQCVVRSENDAKRVHLFPPKQKLSIDSFTARRVLIFLRNTFHNERRRWSHQCLSIPWFCRTSIPEMTSPKTTCLPSKCGAGAKRMKNCDLNSTTSLHSDLRGSPSPIANQKTHKADKIKKSKREIDVFLKREKQESKQFEKLSRNNSKN